MNITWKDIVSDMLVFIIPVLADVLLLFLTLSLNDLFIIITLVLRFPGKCLCERTRPARIVNNGRSVVRLHKYLTQ